MLTVYTDDHHLNDAKAEFVQGHMVPIFEMPKRADYVIERVRQVNLGEVMAPERHPREAIERIHSAEFLSFLETAWEERRKTNDQGEAMPNTWPGGGCGR